ncbi:MAG TPA: lysophospholipid acyltransferase family protein [Polyangiaceae bacterium]|nr:lysophospholipid acyltransferase family protein [Polyangiaceae bacterium]
MQKSALARLTDVAQSTLPFLSRVRHVVRGATDELKLRLLGDDFEERVRTLERRYVTLGGDPFGFDLATARQAAMVVAVFHRMYFRTEVFGIENVPQGRALLIANHSGQIPIDAAILGSAMFFDARPPRITRAMVEKWTATLPFVSAFFSRVGQVVGLQENAIRLLEMGELVLSFPEGMHAINKPFSRRYQLEPFGHGFMRLALRTQTPVVPVAVIGAEEQYLSFGNIEWAARALGLPAFPFVPQLLLPGGAMPLPTKYRLHFGEPMRFYGDAEDDDSAIGDKVWLVEQTINDLLRHGLRDRRGVFL